MPRPDFSGTYKLNVELSELAPLKAPRMRIDSIVHAEPALTVTTLQIDHHGATSTVRKFTTDRLPVTLEVSGKERLLRAWWEENDLVVETSWDERVLTDRWKLSANRRQLVVIRLQQINGKSVSQRFVLDRESGAE